MLLKTWFLLLYLLRNVRSELIYFIWLVSQHQRVTKGFISSNRYRYLYLSNLYVKALMQIQDKSKMH